MISCGISLFVSLLGLLFGGDAAELVFAGDAMQHEAQLKAATINSTPAQDTRYEFDNCFHDLMPDIVAADYAVVNLETPVGAPPFSGYPCFNAPREYASALKEAGFDLFLTANNHTLDRHDRGLRNTIDVLDALNVDHIGTYRSQAARDSVIPLIKRIEGIDFGFLNYTYGTNGITPGPEVVVDYIDREKISSDIRRARDAGAEILVVAIHWGDEYRLLPNASQRALADFLVEEGVDAVIGSHPHVIQPMEIRTRADGNKSLVVYSLGNFISNMKTRDTRGGAMVRTFFVRGADGKVRLENAAYELVFTIPPGVGEAGFKVVPMDEAVTHPRMGSYARAFKKAATDIFLKHNKGVEAYVPGEVQPTAP